MDDWLPWRRRRRQRAYLSSGRQLSLRNIKPKEVHSSPLS
jgi:hypothetical protein